MRPIAAQMAIACFIVNCSWMAEIERLLQTDEQPAEVVPHFSQA